MAGLSRPPLIGVDSREAEAFITRAGEVPEDDSGRQATTALIEIDQARQALERASSLVDVKDIRDKAAALRDYAKQALHSLDMQNRCAEIKLRAERKAGQMLRDQDKNKGAATADEHERGLPRLEDLGITHSQSSRWQAIASVPENIFEERIGKAKAAGEELTSAAFLRLAGKFKPAGERPASDSGDDSGQSTFGFLHTQRWECQRTESTPVGEWLPSSGSKDGSQIKRGSRKHANERPAYPAVKGMVQAGLGFAEIWDEDREIRLTAEKLRQDLIKAREDGWRVISRDDALALIRGLEAALG